MGLPLLAIPESVLPILVTVLRDGGAAFQVAQSAGATCPPKVQIDLHSGAWYRYGDEQSGNGRKKTREYLREHPEFVAELRAKVMELQGHGDLKPASAPTADDAPAEEEQSGSQNCRLSLRERRQSRRWSAFS